MGADINVYAAEYENGTLIRVVKVRKVMTESGDICLDYIKDGVTHELRLLVWNDENNPYRGAQIIDASG